MLGRSRSTSETTMGSLVPSFSLSGLRAAFSASWNWSNRPAYQFKIRHQFELGGFDVKAGPGIDLHPMGLEWMRTLELSSRTTGIKYRMILFDDLAECQIVAGLAPKRAANSAVVRYW